MDLYSNLEDKEKELEAKASEYQEQRLELQNITNNIKDREKELEELKLSQASIRKTYNDYAQEIKFIEANIYSIKEEIKEYEFNKAVNEFLSVQVDFFDALESRIKYHQEDVNAGLVDVDNSPEAKSVVSKLKESLENVRFYGEQTVAINGAKANYNQALKAIGVLKVKGKHIDANARKQPQAVLDNLIFREDIQKLWIQ